MFRVVLGVLRFGFCGLGGFGGWVCGSGCLVVLACFALLVFAVVARLPGLWFGGFSGGLSFVVWWYMFVV